MKKYKIRTVPTQQSVFLKKRIGKTRRRAKFVGLLYLLATIILAALACLPLIDLGELAPLGATEFYKAFLDMQTDTTAGLIKVVNAALYGVLMLAVIINVFKALSKLNWLFKKKASKTYGFNRNVYAMEDLSRIFSGSFRAIVLVYFIIAVLAGHSAIPYVHGDIEGIEMMLITIAIGLVFHFICGILGGKVSLFVVHEGVGVVEQKRNTGRFAPFVRNVVQVTVAFGVMYCFLYDNKVQMLLDCVLGGKMNYITENLMLFIPAILQTIAIIWIMVLVKHATSPTEYSIDGRFAPGMKRFRVCTFFLVLTSIAIIACKWMFGEAAFVIVDGVSTWKPVRAIAEINEYWTSKGRPTWVIVKEHCKGYIAMGIATFISFVLEVFMRKRPRTTEEKQMKKDKKRSKKDAKKAKKEAKRLAKNPPMYQPMLMQPQAQATNHDEVDLDYFLASGYSGYAGLNVYGNAMMPVASQGYAQYPWTQPEQRR